MYVGGGAINANADHLVTKLAELLNLPVTTTLMGLGAFSGTHPQFIGMLGMHGTFEANKTMHNADLIFAVGPASMTASPTTWPSSAPTPP